MRKLGRNLRKGSRGRATAPADREMGQTLSDGLGGSLSGTLAYLRSKMGGSSDVVIRRLQNRGPEGEDIAICYVGGLIDQMLLSELIDDLDKRFFAADRDYQHRPIAEQISTGNVKRITSGSDLISSLLSGSAAIIIDGTEGAIVAPIPGGPRRSVEEPSTQTVIRGPKEGFTEEMSTNMALLRRKIRSPDLRFESRTVGTYTQTKVVVAYIEGVASPAVLQEVLNRLDAIHTDSILEGGYIEEFIQDKVFTPFPTIMNTERPDAAAGSLLEGQVVILVDGSPFVLICPVTFFKFFLSSEDYYQRYDISTFLRWIRLLSFLVAMLLPSLYIAVTTFHPEMLPTTMLISLAAQREGTPLPALFEALLMEITFEVIREAGVRMPRVVGSAISIVGALVLGQAAVQAGLVSAAMVIIVSFTAISNFVIPTFGMSSAVRLIRFGLMLLAGTFGLYGILAGLIPLLMHLVSLRSFGVPYLLPIAPLSFTNMKDVFIRAPWPKMKKRPAYINEDNKTRQGSVPNDGLNKK
ncbi:spore germination protein [Paenibacillus macerans]|uniref:GerA spore germination family protein n=1 Tax=Paenibacillus macerans TaxID=44252 RepID=A0A090ZFK8_PAEMA|nr:spore germination protein [Paenibacillus macerans]KFN09015.1 GerA spore germination family protein [Paenibacillus macerans]MCY7560769.1 spore germination protein [Paenibacillus macerans]MEC0154825.1 spore germination protein [Paenibacillus macerans]SUA82990.1 spore germination protein KA [Paenibacillus macerans]